MFTSLVRKTQEFFGPSNAPRVPLLGAASSTATNVGYSSAGVVTYPQTSEPMTAMSGVVSSSVTPTINNSTKSSGFGGTCTQVANDEAIARVVQANEGDAKRKTQEFFGPSNAPRVPLLGAASSTATNVGYSSAGVVTYPQTSEPMTAMSGVVSSSVTPTINNSTKSSGFGGTCTQVANDEAIASVIQANEGDAKRKTQEFFGPSNVANPDANVANTAPKTPPDDDFKDIIDATLKPEDDCNTLSDLNMAELDLSFDNEADTLNTTGIRFPMLKERSSYSPPLETMVAFSNTVAGEIASEQQKKRFPEEKTESELVETTPETPRESQAAPKTPAEEYCDMIRKWFKGDGKVSVRLEKTSNALAGAVIVTVVIERNTKPKGKKKRRLPQTKMDYRYYVLGVHSCKREYETSISRAEDLALGVVRGINVEVSWITLIVIESLHFVLFTSLNFIFLPHIAIPQSSPNSRKRERKNFTNRLQDDEQASGVTCIKCSCDTSVIDNGNSLYSNPGNAYLCQMLQIKIEKKDALEEFPSVSAFLDYYIKEDKHLDNELQDYRVPDIKALRKARFDDIPLDTYRAYKFAHGSILAKKNGI